MDASRIEEIRTKFEEAGQNFEAEVKERARALGVQEHVARMIVRTANGISGLASHVMQLMGASSEEEVMAIVDRVTKNDDGTYVDFVTMLDESGFSWVSLASTYKAFKNAANLTRDGEILSALSMVVSMNGLLLAAIENMAEEAKSRSGTHAANASHARHRDNERVAREWYAKHKDLTKDDAATRIRDEKIVHASWRTIRKYLTNQ